MGVEADLLAEIEKWSRRLDQALPSVHPRGEEAIKILQNIKAYRADSEHFLERGDLIRSFECLIWAWALLELGKEFGHLE